MMGPELIEAMRAARLSSERALKLMIEANEAIKSIDASMEDKAVSRNLKLSEIDND